MTVNHLPTTFNGFHKLGLKKRYIHELLEATELGSDISSVRILFTKSHKYSLGEKIYAVCEGKAFEAEITNVEIKKLRDITDDDLVLAFEDFNSVPKLIAVLQDIEEHSIPGATKVQIVTFRPTGESVKISHR